MKRIITLFLTVVIAISCFFNSSIVSNAESSLDMSIAFIDCGQGDSILISSDGYNMLVDAGKAKNVDSVINYLDKLGIKELEYVVASHTHEDHIGGLPTVYEKYQVNKSIHPNYVDDTVIYGKYIDVIKQEPQSRYCSVNNGDTWSFGDVSVKVISDGKSMKTVNDTSLVLKLTCGEIDLLLTGDISNTAENKIVTSGENIDAEILKVAHHGSATSSSMSFLNAVTPEISVFSVGKDNQYNHPNADALLRVSSVSSKIFRTDLQGTVLINVKNNTINYDSILENIQKEIYCGVKTVYVTQTGKKYHASSLCSNMKSPIEKQLSEAKEAGYSPCSKCVNQDFENLLEPHKIDSGTVTKKATCKGTGVRTYKCTKCKTVLKTAIIAKNTTHTYRDYVTKATLSKNGKIVRKCSVCGAHNKATTIYYAKAVKLSATSYTYNGKTKTPTVTVKGSNGKTISKSNYTVKYASGRKNVGKYKVTITFKGNYSGTKTLYFKINPVKTSITKLTAAKKALTVSISKKTKQVTGYEIQYATNKKFSKAKKATIKSYKTTKTTLKKLSSKKTYYVRVRTYKTVGKTKYYSGWSTIKYKKTK